MMMIPYRGKGSKVNRGQMCLNMSYGYHIWSEVPLIQAKDDDDLHGSYEAPQRVTD